MGSGEKTLEQSLRILGVPHSDCFLRQAKHAFWNGFKSRLWCVGKESFMLHRNLSLQSRKVEVGLLFALLQRPSD